jgi:hypothetical protein
MLRVYAAAHGMNSTHHAVVEIGAQEITVRVNHRWVRFTLDTMEDSEGNSAAFALQEDGTVMIGEAVDEMDMAAEQVAREIMIGK